ncbi:MAG: hypothetical protein RBG13Loki_3166 [Promethearchaeota archaeon CR_4]|nr:MAG: hypothetical protein RBG13Loki_3166 [Candidatus Lokiarchaeota archaeon CR_4]
MDSYSVQTTDYYEMQSLIWLGTYTIIHDFKSSNPGVWVNHTISRQLTDIDYVGEPPHEDDNDPRPYNLLTDPLFWVAVGVVGGGVIGIWIFIKYMVRRKARREQSVNTEEFEAERTGNPNPPCEEESI